MPKQFNDTGLCIPHRHYMVDTSVKLNQMMGMVDQGAYVTINRPRQFGKTTTLFLLSNALNEREDYLALHISFEDIDSDSYQSQPTFIYLFLDSLLNEFEFHQRTDLVEFTEQHLETTANIRALSGFITRLQRDMVPHKKLVLLIDEVDKSTNNQLFLDFLAMLRNKYLKRDQGRDHSFHSVILAGVHDIKTLKQKIRPDAASIYNSPWNIAVDFRIDLSFSPIEIETMLADYAETRQIEMAQSEIAERLYYYTSGYPYLVSKLCKFIDEDILPQRIDQSWHLGDVETAFKTIVKGSYTTTLLDSLTKNLENNPDLYEFIFQIVLNGERFPFVIANPIVNFGHLYGLVVPSEADRHCRIHNRIFEQRIYDYMMSKVLHTKYRDFNTLGPEFFGANGLDVELILRRFQAFMQEHYSDREAKFLEREGRLLFLSYLRPIVNGKGFEFKEPTVADERRMDIVITYREQRYVIELKRWYGPAYHQRGLQQLSDYLDSYGLKTGYLLIYDFSKNKSYQTAQIQFQDKDIFAVWV